MAFKRPDQGLTLGAWRRAKALSTHPDKETFYWLPCSGTIEGIEWPHCYFITSNKQGHILCPGCREAGPRRHLPCGQAQGSLF